MNLTEEQRRRMGLNDSVETSVARGWTKNQIKEAIAEKGFSIAELARAANKEPGDFYQSLNKRSPKTDKMIAAFLNVHESVIWPNRYFINGVSIDKRFLIEQRSDEELAKINAEIDDPPPIKTVVSWVGGPNGGPLVKFHENKQPASLIYETTKPKNDDGTVNHPFYDDEPAKDVSPMANERNIVTLPLGMIIDV